VFDKALDCPRGGYHQAVLGCVDEDVLPGTQEPEPKALIEPVAPAFVAHLEGAKAQLGPIM
jgi:hypothetical protein